MYSVENESAGIPYYCIKLKVALKSFSYSQYRINAFKLFIAYIAKPFK